MQTARPPRAQVPLVNLDGVYILPGIPRLFQAMVSAHQVRAEPRSRPAAGASGRAWACRAA